MVEVVHGLVYYVCLYAALGTRFVLILDRMVCACSPLKYKRRVTRRRTASTISVMWFLATVLGSVSAMCHYHTRRRMNTVAFIVGSIYLLCAVITYILIVRRLRKSRIQSGRADYQNHNVKLKKEFLMPSVLVCVDIILYNIPLFVINFVLGDTLGDSEWRRSNTYEHGGHVVGYSIIYAVPYLGTTVDAFTYVFCTQHYRRSIAQLLSCCRRCNCLGRTENTPTPTIVTFPTS